MADQKHLELLRQGEAVWNQWREEYPDIIPNLYRAELQGSQLAFFNLRQANLREARLAWADLSSANLESADLYRVKINDARAPYANFTSSNLQEAYLWGSDFREAVFSRANLQDANLMCAQLIGANFSGANLSGCKVFGTSVWKVVMDPDTRQDGLIITPPSYVPEPNEAAFTVNDLYVSQFVFLFWDADQLGIILRAVSERGVLLLGRFGGGGIDVLKAAAERLRKKGYLPMIFDFPRDPNRNYTETIKTLAGLSHFVVVDLSGPSVPQELYATVPHFKIPFVPILEKGRHEWSMFRDILEYPWVMPIVEFESPVALQEMLDERIVMPAEEMARKRQRTLAELYRKN